MCHLQLTCEEEESESIVWKMEIPYVYSGPDKDLYVVCIARLIVKCLSFLLYEITILFSFN